jgi:hypothetical protein
MLGYLDIRREQREVVQRGTKVNRIRRQAEVLDVELSHCGHRSAAMKCVRLRERRLSRDDRKLVLLPGGSPRLADDRLGDLQIGGEDGKRVER